MSVWSAAGNLATDEDLSIHESSMPGRAQQRLGPTGTAASYQKHELAKERIESDLRKRGVSVDGITTPGQLKRAAIWLTLSLMFRDMARDTDRVSQEKADLYQAMYQDEMESITLDYDSSLVPSPPAQVIVTSQLWRA